MPNPNPNLIPAAACAPQWPALVLDRLPRLPAGREGAPRTAALAALAALLQVQQGPPRAREDAAGGLGAAAAKLKLPVRAPPARSQPWPIRAPAPAHCKPQLPDTWWPRAQLQAVLHGKVQGARQGRKALSFHGVAPAAVRRSPCCGRSWTAFSRGTRRTAAAGSGRARVSRRARPTLWPYSFARLRVLSYTLSMRTVPHRLHRPASRHRGACPSCSSLSTLAALRRLASRGRRLAPAGRAARKPARAAALTAAPPRPCAQAQSLLLHVLIVALVSEGGELGAAQFERLRGALRAAPADLAGLYRCAPRRARAGDGPGRGLAGGWSALGSGLLD